MEGRPTSNRHSPPGGGGGTESTSPPSLDYEQKRGRAILEIFETEQVYQRLLAEFIGVFLRDLESANNEQARLFMSRPNLAGLCSNIEQIYHLSQQLCGELKRALDVSGAFDEDASSPVRNAARTPIGPIFRRFASLLQLYEQYVENHAFARADIQEFLDKPAFQQYWKKCADDVRANRFEQLQAQKNEEVSHQNAFSGSPMVPTRLKKQNSGEAGNLSSIPSSMTSLSGYLILPIQRVPRYVLLLKEVQKLTEKVLQFEIGVNLSTNSPQHVNLLTPPHSPALSRFRFDSQSMRDASIQNFVKFYQDELMETIQAFKLVSDAATRMNEAMRSSESSQLMKELQSKFVGANIDLVGGSGRIQRTLIREGELMRVTQKTNRHKSFHFHLLTDMLLYSELLTSGGMRLHRVIPLDGSCKVFSNIPIPPGSQYDHYGAPSPTNTPATNTTSPQETNHKRPSLVRLSTRSKQQQPQPSPETSPRGSRDAESNGEGNGVQKNRAFQVATHTKTLTLYAATMTEKELWVKDIKKAIRELGKIQSSTPPSNSTLFSAEENSIECKICGTHFSLLKRKHNCKRCGVLTCADCCNRKRIFFTKTIPQRCCDICRLEMDLTARDDQPNRFRIFAQIKSMTGLSFLTNNSGGSSSGDRKDPLSRCYFALTQRSTKNGFGMRRGPTSIGHEASFMFPVGPDQEDSPYWVIRVYLLSLGEVGTVTFDVRDLMCSKDMIFKRKIFMTYPLKGPMIDECCAGETQAPLISILFELIMPPALWLTPEMEEEFQRQARKRQSKNAKLMKSSSERSNSKDSDAIFDEEEDEEEEDDEDAFRLFTVEERLRRFEGDEEEEDEDSDLEFESGGANHRSASSHGGMVKTGNGVFEFQNEENTALANLKKKQTRKPLGKLNVDIYAIYERIARERPSFWTVICVKYLYIDTALRLSQEQEFYDALEEASSEDGEQKNNNSGEQQEIEDEDEKSAKSFKDALASLQERYLKFDHNPTIRAVLESIESSANSNSSSHNLLLSPRGIAQRSHNNHNSNIRVSSISVTNTSPKNERKEGVISQCALNFFEQSIHVNSINSNEKKKREFTGSSPNVNLQQQTKPPPLKKSPSSFKESSSSNITGSGVVDTFDHPRSLVLQDLLRTEKQYVASLEVLDEVFITPLMQVAHGASARSVKVSVQLSRVGTGQQPVSATTGNHFSNMLPFNKHRKDIQESRAVANAVKQSEVTVLLQSVRQILTINKQLLRDLETRLNVIDYSKCIGDIFSRFAVVLKVYNSYATNHLTVERILTPREFQLFSRRPSSGMLSTISSSSNKPTSPLSHNNSNKDNPKKDSKNAGGGGTGAAAGAAGSTSPTSTNSNATAIVVGDENDEEGPSESLINFIKVLEEDERCEGRSFVQLLRLPKDRLNRYKRILTSLLMHTPDEHHDAELLRASLRLLDQSEKHISWSLRRRFNLEKLQEIQKSFIKVLPFAKNIPSLVSSRRWFKKEGYLVKRCRRDDRVFKFWLFNDALVYGEKVKANTFRFCRFLMVKDMTVHDLERVDKRPNQQEECGDLKYAFEIRSPEKSFIVMIPLILYDKSTSSSSNLLADVDPSSPSSPTGSFVGSVGSSTTSPKETAAAATAPGSPTVSVNELASEEMKKKLKNDWLREILQCIHDINENDQDETTAAAAPQTSAQTNAETTDSLFKKTAQHNRKINEKAAPVWVHDDSSNTCSQCPNKFTLTFRRHHCRRCGALVCDPCSKARVVLENIHPSKKQRVCKQCVTRMKEEEQEQYGHDDEEEDDDRV